MSDPCQEVPEPEWQARVRTEEAELAGRLQRLDAFFATQEFYWMDMNARGLLCLQAHHMRAYREVIRQRIALFTSAPK